jgi:anti-sigma regulatory factor (Ser/Thr protein kinase)
MAIPPVQKGIRRRMRVEVGGREPLLRNPEIVWSKRVLTTRDKVDIDLRNLTFVCPLDLVGLVSWALSVVRERRGSVVLPNADVSSYLERMNVFQLLRRGGWKVALGGADERQELYHKLLEVTPLADAWAVEELGEQLFMLFEQEADPKRLRALHFAFGELCDNATTHSGGSPIYVAAQRYSGLTSGGPARLELAVADNGIGIPNHLRRNPVYASIERDEDAIAKALQPGVSGTREQRGYGLHDVLFETSQVADGEMVIYSGVGAAVAPIGEEGRRRRFSRLREQLPGTWIQIRVWE